MTGRGAFRAAALAGLAMLWACTGTDPEPGIYLRFENPEVTAGLDSLRIVGVGAAGGDTVPIHFWRLGEDFPGEVALPPALAGSFTLVVRGFKADSLVYQSRSSIAGGGAQKPVRDFRLAAPVLTDAPVAYAARVRDSVVLRPAWETRPGIHRQADSGGLELFTPEAEYAWTREGQVAGRDSTLRLGPLTLQDAGTYLFSARNLAGLDSQEFRLTVKHMLPRIAEIKAQTAVAGDSLAVRAAITRSDELRYSWMKDGRAVGTDSILAFPALRSEDTGGYQLRVSNASDSTETALSNRFPVQLKADPDEALRAERKITAGAQNNSSHGTAIDLDVYKDMLYSEAFEKQSLIDLAFVHSGGKPQLMNAPAAKRAADLTYADDFDSAKLKDTKFVKATAKPRDRKEAWAGFDAGSKLSATAVAEGQMYLVQTTDGNLAWIRIDSLEGGAGASASLVLTVAMALPRP